MRLLRIFLPVLVLTSCLPAFSQRYKVSQENCPSVDLSAKMGPVRDQARSSLCFAFTASDLISYAQDIPAEQRISALDVAINYATIDSKSLYKEAHEISGSEWELSKTLSLKSGPLLEQMRKESPFPSTRLQGGFLDTTVAAYNQRGTYCTENRLPSEKSVVDQTYATYANSKIMQMQNGASDINSSGVNPGMGMTAVTNVSKLTSTLEPLPVTCQKNPDTLENFKSFTDELGKTATENLTNETSRICAPRKTLKKMEYTMIGANPSEDSYSAFVIASNLKNNTPIGISYNADFLTSGRKTPSKASNHASSIVGSRWNSTTGTCEFKLRNSWGQDCSIYASEFQSVCDKGSIWLTEKDINTRIESIHAVRLRK